MARPAVAEGKGNGHAAHEAPRVPTIILSFPPGDSHDVVMRAEHVKPTHIYLAAKYLDLLAGATYSGELTRQAMGQAVGDPAAFIDELRRAGRV